MGTGDTNRDGADRDDANPDDANSDGADPGAARPDHAATTHDWIDQPEGRLRVTRSGEGGHPVLLLSGGGIDNAHLSWSRMLPVMARDRLVLGLDWPKQGGSLPWDGVANHERLLQCVVTVLDHYQLDQADFVGLSQGGAVTLATLIEHPGRVRRSVAIAPGGIMGPFPPVLHQLYWLMAKAPLLGRTLPWLMLRRRRTVERFLHSSLFAGDPPADFDQIVDDVLAEIRRRGNVSSTDWQNTSIQFGGMRVDLRPQLPTISRPTLFIQGDRDIGVAPRFTKAAAAAVPDARLEMLRGVGHWPNRQEPDRVNQLVADFLA